MKFLYTNASEADGVQTKATLSLGGYVSSSGVVNNVLNEIFGEVSLNADTNTRYRLLAIKNTLTYTADNVQLKFYLNEDIVSQLQVALVTPTKNECDEYLFEQLPNQYSKPQYADFEVVEDGLVLNIGSLGVSEVIGLWVSRTLVKELISAKSCAQLAEEFANSTPIETEDSIQIDLSWSEPESVSISISESASQSAS